MATIFFLSYCINMPLKRFVCLQNKFCRHFILFFLNCSLERTNIWMGSCLCFVALSAGIVEYTDYTFAEG